MRKVGYRPQWTRLFGEPPGKETASVRVRLGRPGMTYRARSYVYLQRDSTTGRNSGSPFTNLLIENALTATTLSKITIGALSRSMPFFGCGKQAEKLQSFSRYHRDWLRRPLVLDTPWVGNRNSCRRKSRADQ